VDGAQAPSPIPLFKKIIAMFPKLARLALSAVAIATAALVVMQAPRAPANAEAPAAAQAEKLDTAIFASGCFWCSESDFEKLPGVVSVVSGYTGGQLKNPKYEQVGNGDTGHTEAVEVKFDASKVSYQALVDYYWRHTDVVDGGGQFCDRGSQYRPAIFVRGAEQKKIAQDSKAALDKSGVLPAPVTVEITDATEFYPAEGYHQDYYKTHAIKYNFYRQGCGRDARLKALWGQAAGH
jgi:methionine-S-sulfoxide reductase